jgi:hypothetical protein
MANQEIRDILVIKLKEALANTNITKQLYLPVFLVDFPLRKRKLICEEIKKMKDLGKISAVRTSMVFMQNPKTGTLFVYCKSNSNRGNTLKSIYFFDGDYYYSHIYLR